MKTKKMSKAATGSRNAPLDLPVGYKAQSFVRFRDNLTISLSALDFGQGWYFNLAQVPDFGEFTALYDAYIIDKVDLRFVLQSNYPEKYPILIAAPDYDDATVPATVDELLTKQGVQVLNFSATKREHTVSVRPRVAMTAFRTGITSSYGWSKPGQLIDIATTDTPFYGMKTWLTEYNSTNTPGAGMRVYVTYHMRFVGQR
jgi:hypothetical protein